MEQVDVQVLCDIAREAGKVIMEFYEEEYNIESKEDDSPLTQADIASNDIITKRLQEAYPDIPIMSEETKQDSFETRQNWQHFFCVDPIDGTKEFIKKNGEFTVNIGYIKENKPLLGVIFAPALGEMYFSDGTNSFIEINSETKQLPLQEAPKDTVVASRSHCDEKTKEIIDEYGFTNIVSKGSSLKFCLVAQGFASAYIRNVPSYEWDTAAADAILRTVGKEITSLDDSRPWAYNKENLLNPGFKVL